MIAPEKKSVEHLRTAPSMRIKRKIKVKPTGLAAILCSGFAFNSITFYSLLEIFSNSSETIKTEGPAFCYFPGERSCILGCLERFRCLGRTEYEVFILLWKFQGYSYFDTDQFNILLKFIWKKRYRTVS